ncbi:hypothetical protein, conserved in T. vivax, (fragment), partial [Trypanosoma vivax Y486]
MRHEPLWRLSGPAFCPLWLLRRVTLSAGHVPFLPSRTLSISARCVGYPCASHFVVPTSDRASPSFRTLHVSLSPFPPARCPPKHLVLWLAATPCARYQRMPRTIVAKHASSSAQHFLPDCAIMVAVATANAAPGLSSGIPSTHERGHTPAGSAPRRECLVRPKKKNTCSLNKLTAQKLRCSVRSVVVSASDHRQARN